MRRRRDLQCPAEPAAVATGRTCCKSFKCERAKNWFPNREEMDTRFATRRRVSAHGYALRDPRRIGDRGRRATCGVVCRKTANSAGCAAVAGQPHDLGRG